MECKRTEFPAIATTYVGNFTGNCTIQLNGQAIVVISRGVEINRWPYNCIRQFRAEDETGKFSFVSGRRGPYGVAEYNFKLLSDSLIDLQSVLTEFTGAQFSAVAPGSGTDQQAPPPQPLQHLPSYPTMPRQSSTSSSNSYTTSIPRHMTTGGRNDSSSDVDSVFNSPARSQAPRLPPRDYSMTLPGDATLAHSVDEATLRGLNRARATTPGSGTMFGLDTGNYSTPRPALPPPRREAKEPSPEVLVAKSNSYEEAHLTGQQGKGKAEKQPAVPTKKRSLFHRNKKSTKSSASSDHSNDVSEPHTDASSKPHVAESKPLANGKPHDNPLEPVLGTLPEEEPRERTSGAKRESPYDHLPSGKDQIDTAELAASATHPSSGPTSPIGSEGKRSPDLNHSSSNLDYIPRSSPTVQVRSITPEHAQHLRKLSEREGPVRVSATLRGRKSPPSILAKKSLTLGHIAIEDVANKVTIPGEDDSLYNVPRPADATYNVPKSMMDSPPSPRSGNGSGDNTYATPKSNGGDASVYSTPKSNGNGENVYSAPKPVDYADGGGIVSYGGSPEEGMYNVPSSVASREEGGVSEESSAQPTGRESLYNVPRSLSNDMVDNAAYNDIIAHSTTFEEGSDQLYNTPRPVQSRAPISPKANYESIDVDAPRFHTLRSARSFESLSRNRIHPITNGERKMSAYISSPSFAANKAPKCEYVDIDIANRPPALAPAKNAPLPPLPPLPTPAGPNPIVDSVYAEITEETIARGRQMSVSSQPQNPAHALYNELPPARLKFPDSSAMAREGMAKAQELAEEEGYELFMPAATNLRTAQHEESHRVDSTYPPVTTASALLQKYHINIHESTVRSRPFSESDVLEDSRPSSNKYGTSVSDDLQSDEYVIVTGPDTRPKTMTGGPQNPPLMEDEYETMASAHAQLQNHESHYATPNPTLWAGVSCVPQPQLSGPTTGITRQSSAGRAPAPNSAATPPLPSRKYDRPEVVPGAGIDLDAMSPADPNSAPLYSNFHQHERQSSSLSSSSGRSEGGTDLDGDKGPLSVPISCQTAMVKIMAGSPMDPTDAADLKTRTRTFDNVLDHSTPPQSDIATASTTTHSRSTSHTPSPSPPSIRLGISLTPPLSKRHNYVNCTPKEGDEAEEAILRQRTASAPKSNKRPRPLPRSSVLLRGDSTGNM